MKYTEKRLLECCDVISDGDHLPPPKSAEGIPFITISNITKQNLIDFKDTMFVPEAYYDNLSENKKARKGNILYSVVGSFGKPVLINNNNKFVFQRHIAILKTNKTVNNKYIYYAMLNPLFYKKMDKLAIGCSQRTITLDILRNVKIQLPELHIQDVVSTLLSNIDKKINLNSAINDNLAA